MLGKDEGKAQKPRQCSPLNNLSDDPAEEADLTKEYSAETEKLEKQAKATRQELGDWNWQGAPINPKVTTRKLELAQLAKENATTAKGQGQQLALGYEVITCNLLPTNLLLLFAS